MWIKTGLAILTGYLIGSIPFSYILPRWLKGIDIRKSGTKNVGAANVYICCGILPSLMAGVLDVGKGVAAVMIAKGIANGLAHYEAVLVMAGLAAIIGHIRPVFLGFVGGKGIATTCGVLVNLVPKEIFIAAIIWIGVAAISRYATVAGLVAGTAVPLLVWYFSRSTFLVISTAIMVLLIGLMTISSYKALFAGTALRIGQGELRQKKSS